MKRRDFVAASGRATLAVLAGLAGLNRPAAPPGDGNRNYDEGSLPERNRQPSTTWTPVSGS